MNGPTSSVGPTRLNTTVGPTRVSLSPGPAGVPLRNSLGSASGNPGVSRIVHLQPINGGGRPQMLRVFSGQQARRIVMQTSLSPSQRMPRFPANIIASPKVAHSQGTIPSGMTSTSSGGPVRITQSQAFVQEPNRVLQHNANLTGNAGNNATPQLQLRKIAPKPTKSSPEKPNKQARILMRLRCRSRPLHETYFEDNTVIDKDADVLFLCADGGRVKGHKLILASSSKFFTDILHDQPIGDVSILSVPDIPSDIMKLIILLSYKSSVVLSTDQVAKVKECSEIFGIDFDNLTQEPVNKETISDVTPGKLMEPIRHQSLNAQRSPMRAAHMNPCQSGPHQPRRMVPSFNSSQIQSLSGMPRKVPTAVRSGMYQTIPMGPYRRGGDEDTDNSEDSEVTFQLQGYASERQHQRKSKLTPRVETETDDMSEMDVNRDPVASEHMINEWIAQVGKNDPESKRPRLAVPISKGSQGRGQFECTVCDVTFSKESARKWHEDRHVGLGLFKCTMCDVLKPNPRTVWFHEQSIHGLVELPLAEIEESPEIGQGNSNSNILENRTGFPAKNTYGQPIKVQAVGQCNRNMAALRMAQLKRLKAVKFAAMKKVPETRPTKPFPQANHAIGIGHSDGAEQIDSKKLKQLHWLYVCARCDNCSDSSTKAHLHYKKCYPDGDATFESTVTKYRQGFYGKSKCPLCPRRYAANGGFMIHCGHMHTDFRKMFSHTGSTEDKLKCVNCHRKFGLPEEFHYHLDNGQECNNSPINEESMPLLSQGRNSGGGGTPTERNKRRSPIKSAADEDTPAPTPVTPPVMAQLPVRVPPRSARLAKRLAAAAPTPSIDEAEPEQAPLKRRASEIDYPPTNCPVCGAAQVENISKHLKLDHTELNVTVTRIATDLLRCRKCLITFAICDLLAHATTCTASDETSDIDQLSVSDTKSEISNRPLEQKAPKEKETPTRTQESWPIPEGVGCSPIESIEMDVADICRRETLEKAMVCCVCGRKASKIGDISVCLKQHGIFRCSLCFNSYSNKEDYQHHARVFHTGPGNKLKCLFCDKTFINVGQVVGHLHITHWSSILKEIKIATLEAKAEGEVLVETAPTEGELKLDETEKDNTANVQSEREDVQELENNVSSLEEKLDKNKSVDTAEVEIIDKNSETDIKEPEEIEAGPENVAKLEPAKSQAVEPETTLPASNCPNPTISNEGEGKTDTEIH